ncbi:MAG: leucine-rich repeat domain-containing protein [Bacteroidales bacterium]|nr:leucine-rich repeat domain-containing protein [Bacteroidales bacterium]
MKKIVLTLLSIVFSVTLMGQTFTIGELTYTVIEGGNNVSVKRVQNPTFVNLVIPSQVENGSTTYTVTKIENEGFKQTNGMKTVSIPASVTSIGNSAFQGCGSLLEVDMGVNVTSIGTSAFKECHSLHSILLPSGVTTIADNCFENCHGLNEFIFPANVTSIGEYAFHNVHSIELIFMGCGNNGNIVIGSGAFQNCNNVHVEVLCLNGLKFNDSYQNVFGNNAVIHTPCGSAGNYEGKGWIVNPDGGCVSTTRQSGYFCLPETWQGYDSWINNEGSEYPKNGTYEQKEAWLKNNNNNPADDRYPDFVPRKPNHPFHIASGHTVTLKHVRHIYPYNSINEGVIRLEGNGQLIERDTVFNDGWGENSGITDESNLGFVHMHENLGGVIEIVVPTEENNWNFIGAPFNGYDLYAVKSVQNTDVAIVEFDYGTGVWGTGYALVGDEIGAGEGFFAWPFEGNGNVVFSTKRDMGTQSATDDPQQSQAKIMEADFALNNDNVVVTKNVKNITGTNAGNWMALANPYPAKLCVSSFLSENSTAGIQGEGVYVFDNTNGNGAFSFKNNYDLGIAEGFFVNFTSEGEKTVGFTKNQLHEYNEPNHTPSKAKAAREFIRLSMADGESNIELLFAHNEDAEQGYDIYDANKMFATTGVSEPYFVTEGIALVKEEVKELPYYATMNVRSSESKEVKFKADYIPEGLAVSIIDGEEVIDLVEGGVYSTEIASGENADRFKVLVKKNVGLVDVEELDVRITNSNRHITITAQENVRTEVYNTLGQKVFETEDTNFVLSGVASGAYVVKVQGAKASKSQKVVVE